MSATSATRIALPVTCQRWALRRIGRSLTVGLLVAALSGCAFMAGEVAVAPQPAPEPAPVVQQAPPQPTPAPPPAAPAAPPRTAIVLSQNIPALAGILDALQESLDADLTTVHDLAGRPSNTARIVAEIERTAPDRLIAIGLLAATVARQFPGTPMVFSQVYNYHDHDLISATSKGVNFLPPFEMQLDAWRTLSPTLRSVGIITGPGQDDLIGEIERATERHGVELSVRTVQSDKEALFAFKRLTPDIQGIWLLPDNRILSPEVVREIMSYSAKHRKQVVVFGENLLRLGALMSVASDHGDVAERVLARFADLPDNGRLKGPSMVSLTDMHTTVNHEVARHLGLIVPEQLAGARAID